MQKLPYLFSFLHFCCYGSKAVCQVHMNRLMEFENTVQTGLRYNDNSVHLYECSPFWVGILINLNKENFHVYGFM